jgi:hypothetical protein
MASSVTVGEGGLRREFRMARANCPASPTKNGAHVAAVLEARAKPPLWRLILFPPFIALLIWGVQDVLSPTFFEEEHGWRMAGLAAIAPPWAIAAFFALCLIAVTVLFALQCWARLTRRLTLVADDSGLTGHMWLRSAKFAWPSIISLHENKGILRVVGREASGRKSSISVQLHSLDVPRMAVLSAIADRRPDLLKDILSSALNA